MFSGLSEKEAMEISGHRTRSVFDRYHIVSERRLKEVAGKLESTLESEGRGKISPATRNGQLNGARQRCKTKYKTLSKRV
jgi:hypothetical protein